MIVLIGQAFIPNEEAVAVTPAASAMAVSTTDVPSSPTVAVAFSTTLSEPVMENHAHELLATFSSVLQ